MLTYSVQIRPGEPAAPLHATSWMLAWEQLGGGVTIGPDDSIEPWLFAEIADATTETLNLVKQIVETPGLAQAVRIVLRNGWKNKAAAA